MSTFGDDTKTRQVNWRKTHVATSEHGLYNGKPYPWILPSSDWEEGLYPSIRSGNDQSLSRYIEAENIQPHTGKNNLCSSWVLCANLYFPFRSDPNLLAGFLREHVNRDIQSVSAVDLEYAEDPPCDPASLLGERKGKRGANQTSPDVAFVVNGGKGLILTESKYTEHSFYRCSGRKKENGIPDSKQCLDIGNVLCRGKVNCYMSGWKNEDRENRKYWEFLRFSPAGEKELTQCPAATAGYQLLRQQALAEALATKCTKYNLVVSCVAYDKENIELTGCLKSGGVPDFTKNWGPLFSGKAQFSSFSHQNWVQWVRQHGNPRRWKEWVTWIHERYGY